MDTKRSSFDKKGFYRDVGLRLQVMRKSKGFTQQQVAGELGVSRATYANVETGRQSMALDLAWRVAVFFRLSLDKIVPEPIYDSPPRGVPLPMAGTTDFTIDPAIRATVTMP